MLRDGGLGEWQLVDDLTAAAALAGKQEAEDADTSGWPSAFARLAYRSRPPERCRRSLGGRRVVPAGSDDAGG